MLTLIVKDETAAGDILNEIELKIDAERLTVKELIECRVKTEVEKYNAKSSTLFRGLVQPSDTEKQLNGFKQRSFKKIDAEQQVYIALEAFLKNGYFIIVNNEQVTELETELLLSDKMDISFLKLTPLVGG